MYYNTTNETGDILESCKEKVSKQEREILEMFRKSDKGLSPWQVEIVSKQTIPIQSISRALSNLTDRGLLVKTAEKRKGRYGRDQHVWKAA